MLETDTSFLEQAHVHTNDTRGPLKWALRTTRMLAAISEMKHVGKSGERNPQSHRRHDAPGEDRVVGQRWTRTRRHLATTTVKKLWGKMCEGLGRFQEDAADEFGFGWRGKEPPPLTQNSNLQKREK